jgi:putative membrane protein
MMYGYWGFWPFFGIIWVIFWVVFSGIGWRNRGNRWGRSPDKSALDMLKERYAKGEIGKAEFEEKKRDIA